MKIIIVERDVSNAFLYHEEFSDLGYEVVSLNGGAVLLETIEKEKPDALILGVLKAGHVDFGLLEKVKAAYPKLPVIFNTSLSEYKEEAIERGADFFNVKSADLTDLVGILKQIEKNIR